MEKCVAVKFLSQIGWGVSLNVQPMPVRGGRDDTKVALWGHFRLAGAAGTCAGDGNGSGGRWARVPGMGRGVEHGGGKYAPASCVLFRNARDVMAKII